MYSTLTLSTVFFLYGFILFWFVCLVGFPRKNLKLPMLPQKAAMMLGSTHETGKDEHPEHN